MQKERGKKAAASIGLLGAAFFWGFAFVVVKNSVDAVPPTYMLAFRFTIAAAGLSLIFWKKWKLLTKTSLFMGGVLGFWLFLSYYLQTEALKYTTASNNAFLTTGYVVIVPFLHWLISKKRPGGYQVAAAFLAITGIGCLSLNGNLSMNPGDILTLICGFGYAVHMVYIDKYTEKADAILLTVLQLFTVALLSWILAPFIEGGFPAAVWKQDMIVSMLYLGLFSTMIGFLLQNVCQKYVNPSTASILLSTESVFGVLFGVLILGEMMNLKMMAGCVLMFTAILLSETKFQFLKITNKKKIVAEESIR